MPSLQNWLKRLVETRAEQFRATVSAEESGSETTTFYVDEVAGFGDDYFNDEWWIQVVETTDAGAPEGQWRQIDDYVSNTGKFVVKTAYSANVNTGDNLLFLHEYQYGVGARDDAALATDTADNGTQSLITLNRGEIDRIGNLNDAADYTYSATTSTLVQLIKGILGSRVIAEGTFTTGTTTTSPVDSALADTYIDNYFNGCILMPVAGADILQPRLIVDFVDLGAGLGARFEVDPEHPFTANVGTVAYVVIANEGDLAPATDGANDTTTAHVVGAKADTADYTYNATTSSLVRLVKGLLGAKVIAEGTFTTDSATVPADTSRTEVSNFFDGQIIMPVEGACALQPRLIANFNATGDVFTLDAEHPFTGAPGLSKYIIIANEADLVPAADSTNNLTMAHVIGNKSDAANATAGQASVIGRLAAVRASTGIFHEQADVAVTINAISGSETNVFDLSAANTRYIVRSLRLKSVDPNPNTITVRLYELINDVLTVVSTHTIDSTNFGTYFTLVDMFGVPHLAGDNLKVTVQSSAGTYAIVGQYSYGKNNV